MIVNLNQNLDIHAFSGSGITVYEAGLTNCVVHKKGEGESARYKTTQRPSIDITQDSKEIAGLKPRGRGIYYWEINSKLYIVNDDSVYSQSQNTTPIATIGAGSDRVTMLETVGVPRLVILDAENNQGWYMGVGESLVQIDSTGATGFFPTTLVHGGAILDSYLFVMDEDGLIYNSNVDDPSVFDALGFIEAERDNDKGVYLGKHHDNIVSFNTRTVEFFYDSGDKTGSPLSRRQDISYNIGCASGSAVYENGDKIYFIGSNQKGQLSIYLLDNFRIKPISQDTMSSYITEGLTQNSLSITLNGIAGMGSDIILMTVFATDGGTSIPKTTLSFDTTSGLWGIWSTSLNNLNSFPVIAWTRRTGGQNAQLAARTGEGIFSNGDILNIHDNLVPIDTIGGSSGVYEDGVYEVDVYAASTSAIGNNIAIKGRAGLQDAGAAVYKFQSKETIVMENTKNQQIMTIKHSDESADNFDSGVQIDVSCDRKDAHQGGRFMKRNFQFEYSGNEQIYIEALDIELEAGL